VRITHETELIVDVLPEIHKRSLVNRTSRDHALVSENSLRDPRLAE
jgi:hypothetical protein